MIKQCVHLSFNLSKVVTSESSGNIRPNGFLCVLKKINKKAVATNGKVMFVPVIVLTPQREHDAFLSRINRCSFE